MWCMIDTTDTNFAAAAAACVLWKRFFYDLILRADSAVQLQARQIYRAFRVILMAFKRAMK